MAASATGRAGTKKAAGKAPMEAMRCVKRRLSDIVYQASARQMSTLEEDR
jgi:hypothetical protein